MERRGHPLPHPSSILTSISMAYDDRMVSSSESCFSSLLSFDDTSECGFNGNHRYSEFTNLTRGRSLKSNSQRQQHVAENRHFASGVVFPDISTSPRNEFHCLYGATTPPNGNGLCTLRTSPEIKFKPKSRSPTSSPLPTGQTFPTSPFHQQTHCFGTESSTEKQQDGMNQGHPLPLPPSSINSSTSHTSWNTGVNDNVQCLNSRWKKGKLLGRGTFGHVFAGFNSENGQMCAIKEVKVISDDQNSKECLRQLNHEIDLLSQLSHPNIVRYYGSELNEDTLSVYLECVSGGSIHKLLQEYGPFPEPVIQSYTRQILSGLAYLHRRNTVHRDIKGANILVDPNGEIKLGDFGLAKHVTSSSVLSCKGSPYWMAPEVIMNNSNGYNVAVDIWSLGCTILEMATSKPPWSQYEGVAAMFKIGNSKDIPQIPDHFSDDGKDFLKLCLQHDPSLRPTAVKLLEHPFVRDQAMEKIAKININGDTFQSKNDITHLLNKIAVLSNQMNALQYDGDYDIRHIRGFSKHCNISSDQVHARTNSSLPVSPCSRPLQRSGSTRQSSLSSTHPAYTTRMGGYAMIGHAFFPSQTNANLMEKQIENNPYPRPDISQLKVQTHTGSPRVKRMPSW